jgi:hypothetical protein
MPNIICKQANRFAISLMTVAEELEKEDGRQKSY